MTTRERAIQLKHQQPHRPCQEQEWDVVLIDHYRGSKAYIHRSLDCQKQGPCVLSQKLELLVNVNSWHIYNCFEGKKFQMRNWKYFKWEIENISNSMFIKSCTHRVKVKGHLLTWRHLLQLCVYPVICVASMCLFIFWFTCLFHRHCKHERKSFHFKHNFSPSCFLFFHDSNNGLYAF